MVYGLIRVTDAIDHGFSGGFSARAPALAKALRGHANVRAASPGSSAK